MEGDADRVEAESLIGWSIHLAAGEVEAAGADDIGDITRGHRAIEVAAVGG